MKQTFFAAPALLVALIVMACTTQAQVKTEDNKTALPASINISAVNTNEGDEMELNYKQDGHRYKVRLNGSRIMELQVDGKKIPEVDHHTYEPGIRKILDQVEKDRKQADLDRAEMEKHRQQATKDREQVNQMREQVQKEREETAMHRAQADKDRERANEERKQADRERGQASLAREQAEKDRARAAVDREKAAEDRRQMEAMVEELLNDKLIADRESLTSLELDAVKLVVNGKEQPAALHQRYKQKYLKDPHRRLQYRSAGGTRTMTIN